MPTYLQTTKNNIRAAMAVGHSPVSSGCGMFRCTTCGLSAYLDTDSDSRWFEPCPAPAALSPCRPYAAGLPCKDGRDHCYRCGRHLDGKSCPKNCKPNDG